MSMIDFANSYVSFFGPQRDDGARVPIDASCTLIDEAADYQDTFYLIAPCRSEDMYRDDRLFYMPNWDWRAIFNASERVILRKHWESMPAQVTDPSRLAQYDDGRGAILQLKHHSETRPLTEYTQVVEEALGTRPIVARTEITEPDGRLRAILEYPVRTMNARTTPPRFQVDTGPLIVPDFESEATHAIERFDVAHVGYNVYDKAEFILRRPVTVPQGSRSGVLVTDYSELMTIPASNEIFVAV
jgi:hypothetical protein